MPDKTELDGLYREAKSALKTREYDRAAGMLTQILVIDENYKDVPRLLAQTVKLKRRRWYNHPALWGALGFVLLIGLGIGLSKFLPQQTAMATQPVESTVTPSTTTIPATATVTLTPTATPIPLTWKRISMGLEFERDTVTAFATDKKDQDVIYAAMQNAGVYKTIDGGLSWYPAHQGLASTQVESLLIDSQNPQILYAGTMGGIFKTEDGGENWFRVGDGTYLLMDWQDNSHLYARDENGIYETTDQGNNWATVYTLKKDCPDEIHSWAIHPADGKMLFIGGGETCAGVYQSSNNGGTWTLIGMEDKPNLDALAIGLDEQGNYSIYIYFRSLIGSENGMYVTHDRGANWSFTHSWCDILTSDPDNPATIYCAGSRLLVIQKKGDTWQQIPGTQSKGYTAVQIDHPNGTERIITGTIYFSTSNPYVGTFISTDGGTSWVKQNFGIGSGRSELKIDPMDSARIYLAAYYKYLAADYFLNQGSCTLYSSLDSGKNWSPLRAADWCGPTFGEDNALYLIEQNALQMSANGGETWLWGGGGHDGHYWEEQSKYILPSYYRGGSSESVSANLYTEGLVYYIGDKIYYSTGSGWQISSGSESLRDARLFYKDLGQTVFAIGRTHQAYSTDSGVTWQNCGEDVTASRSDSRLALDLDGSRLYLATPGQGVLISTDNCRSWQQRNEGLSNLFVNTLAIDPNDANKIYAGTDGGAYISFDAGATWGQVNDGLLGAVVVYSIAVDKESNVYAATPYGIFKLENK